MPTYTGNYNVQTKPWAVGNLPSQAGVVYKPTYNLLGGFEGMHNVHLCGNF